MIEHSGTRGVAWFRALESGAPLLVGDPASVLAADALLGEEAVRYLCVVPNPDAKFPCARHGEVGLEEAYALASRIREVIKQDQGAEKRAIVAIVDVRSQAYGKREEMAGIFVAAATAADAYGAARLAGHPVIALVVGHAFSGGFLTHGYQANRILAFDDPGVTVHAMHKEAAARITRRSIESLDALGDTLAPLSYKVRDFAKLGILHKLLQVENPESPTERTVAYVRHELIAAIRDAREGSPDLSHRLDSSGALDQRKAARLVRSLMQAQWKESR